MTGESDRDLPLHDEAEARSKWRGEENKLDSGVSGPASEADDDAQGGQGSRDELADALAQRPPD